MADLYVDPQCLAQHWHTVGTQKIRMEWNRVYVSNTDSQIDNWAKIHVRFVFSGSLLYNGVMNSFKLPKLFYVKPQSHLGIKCTHLVPIGHCRERLTSAGLNILECVKHGTVPDKLSSRPFPP